MECKNCLTNLKETAKFCDECGGKVINHRLNFKIVTAEFLETFISWDNKFFKTFMHLITKPQVVANGYLDGVRKRYMQPFSYILISLTLYGIYLVFSKEMLDEYINEMILKMPNLDLKSQKTYKKLTYLILKYNNIYTFSTIPLYAFINRIIFRKRNFIEHSVALLYLLATIMFLTSISGFLGVLFNVDYEKTSYINAFFMIFYSMYYYKKMFNLDNATIILKTLFFWLLMLAFYIILFIIGVIIVVILLSLKIITP